MNNNNAKNNTDDQKQQFNVERLQQELLNAEKSGKFSYEELGPLWEQAKEAIEDEQQAVSLYTTYIYLTRRFIDKQGTGDYTRMKELFQEAVDFLAECFEEYSDASMQLDKNYAFFLYTKMRKPDKARQIWQERLLVDETGPFAWLEAAALERAYGGEEAVEQTRRLFYKAIDAVTFRPHDIFSAFVQFEREEGKREDLDRALERINARVAEFNKQVDQRQYFKQKQQQINAEQKQHQHHPKNRRENPAGRRGGGNDRNSKKKEAPQPQREKPPKQKGNKRGEEKMDTGGEEEEVAPAGTFQTSSVPLGPMIPGMEMPAVTVKEEIPKEATELEKANLKEEPKNDAEMDEEKEKPKPTQKRKREPTSSEKELFPYGTGLEKNKLFVKQLHFGCKEAELKQFFSKFGRVLDTRVVTKWNGKSKGCAYVDFASDEEAAAALVGADGAEIRGKKIAVYLSNPPPKKPRFDEGSANTESEKQPTGAPKSEQPTTSSATAAPKQAQNQQQQKKSLGHASSLFAPRALTAAGQRAGKGGRLMLPNAISKGTASTNTFSPVGAVTHSTEEMSLGQTNSSKGNEANDAQKE